MTTTRTAFPAVLCLMLIVMAAFILLQADLPQIVTAVPNPPLNKHAVDRHPSLAQRIHQCLDDKGPEMIYKDKRTGRQFLCVELPDGKWGFKIVQKIGGQWQTITAYYKGNGSLKTLVDYFAVRGMIEIQ